MDKQPDLFPLYQHATPLSEAVTQCVPLNVIEEHRTPLPEAIRKNPLLSYGYKLFCTGTPEQQYEIGAKYPDVFNVCKKIQDFQELQYRRHIPHKRALVSLLRFEILVGIAYPSQNDYGGGSALI